MQKVIFFALMISCAASVGIAVLVREIARALRALFMASILPLITGMILIMPIYFGVLKHLDRTSLNHGLNSSPQTANKTLMLIEVPLPARHVDYFHSFIDSMSDAADFALEKPDFITWMTLTGRGGFREFSTKDNGVTSWKNSRLPLPSFGGTMFSGSGTKPPLSIRLTTVDSLIKGAGQEASSEEKKHIRNGYYFDDIPQGSITRSGYVIVYDGDTSRAMVRYEK